MKRKPLPPLCMSLEQAKKRLKAQIEKGQAIRARDVKSRNDFTLAVCTFYGWQDQNCELLLRMFADDSIEEEHLHFKIKRRYPYLPPTRVSKKPTPEETSDLRKSIYDRIAHLDSVTRRLGLKSLIHKRRQSVKPDKQMQSTKQKHLAKPAKHISIMDPVDVKKIQSSSPSSCAVFIVHGHDDASKESTSRYIERLGLQAIVLHEQPNAGRTIIEKFEDYSNVGFAIVLLTPDDVGAPKDKTNETKPRARQNVILELGYFMGKLGRGRVCALYKEGVEIPSDYQGVLYIQMDSAGAWKMQLAKEIKNAGIEVDLNKL